MTIGVAGLGEHNAEVEAFVHTFSTDPDATKAPRYAAPDTVAGLRAAQEFEVCVDPATPLALWDDGMLAARAVPPEVLARFA